MAWAVSALVALALGTLVHAQAPADAPSISLFPSPWADGGAGGDGWADAYAKARAWVGNLTLVEKVNLTTGTGWESDRCIGNTGSLPRLGFRALCLQDGPVGVRYTDQNSVFPAGINAAATFSRTLLRRRGAAMGAEFRGKGVDVQLGPVAGPLGRVPAGGRNWEGFSPDPYLAGVGMAATIEGIQGAGVIACAKHYILNEQEHDRNSMDVTVDDRAMHELYLWPFADAVRAGVGSVMCSYNKIHGHYSCENGWTNNYLLKNELNFQGFIMSDWGAQHSTIESALGGLDMAMPGDGGPRTNNPYGAFWGGALTAAVLNGSLPAWRVDDMAVRIMAAYYKVIQNEANRTDINFSAWVRPNVTVGPVYYRANASIEVVNKHVDVQADHGPLIREIGAKSIVLLKNQGVLPLQKNPATTIAIIGDDAQSPPVGDPACEDNKCYQGTLAMGYGSGTANFPYVVSPAEAIREVWGGGGGAGGNRTRPAGANASSSTIIEASNNWDVPAAQRAAAAADVALVFASADAGEGYLTVDGNTGDRNNLTLWGNGEALIRAVAAVNNNTVVVLHTVGPVAIAFAAAHENVTAILWAGLPGQESGHALTDVLFEGGTAPQGRSPFTWGRNASEYGAALAYQPASVWHPAQTFAEGVYIDYRHFQQAGIEPVYAFGHGLTYTQFAYRNLTVVAAARGQSPDDRRNGTTAPGRTRPAPHYGTVNTSVAANTMPAGFAPVKPYIYPWVMPGPGGGPDNATVSADPRADGAAQAVLPAGGAPGGHPGLYETVYTVAFTVQNTGHVAATDVPQLYVQLGGDNPPAVLRGFDDVYVPAGGLVRVSMNLTRRDISNWDAGQQNWVVSAHNKTVMVGRSVADIVLRAPLPGMGEESTV